MRQSNNAPVKNIKDVPLMVEPHWLRKLRVAKAPSRALGVVADRRSFNSINLEGTWE
jgi:hypothetical protein